MSDLSRSSHRNPLVKKSPQSGRLPTLEVLEARIAPAAVVAPPPIDFTYTDGDGDLIHVVTTGKATVSFQDAQGNELSVAGAVAGDIANIIITAPSADFSISFADINPGQGGDVVKLGRISGPDGAKLPIIRGIFTSATGEDVSYELGSFVGTDFSAGGGLRILGSLAGDGDPDNGPDLHLTSLAVGTSVFLRDGVNVDSAVKVDKDVTGTFTAAGDIDGSLTFGSVTGSVNLKTLDSELHVLGNFAGRLTLGNPDAAPVVAGAPFNPIQGTVKIDGDLTARGVITANEGLDLTVGKTLFGIVNVAQDANVKVTKSLNTANILVGGDLLLNVGVDVLKSAVIAQHEVLPGSKTGGQFFNSSILAGTGLTLEIGAGFRNSRLSGGSDDVSVTLGGTIRSSQLTGGGYMDLSTKGHVIDSTILPDGALTFAGSKNAIRSTLGSKSSNVSLTFTGQFISSKVLAGDDLNVTIEKGVRVGDFSSGGNLEITSRGLIANAKVIGGSQSIVNVTGGLRTSSIYSGNDIALTTTAGITSSRLESTDGSIVASSTGAVTKSVFDSGESLTLDVKDLKKVNGPSAILKLVSPGMLSKDVTLTAATSIEATTESSFAGKVVSGGSAMLTAGKVFAASVNATGDLSLQAGEVRIGGSLTGGTVPSTTVVQPTRGGSDQQPQVGLRTAGNLSVFTAGNFSASVTDVGGDITDFQVGKNFTGKLYVAGNFIAGVTDSTTTVIGGVVSQSSLIHIGGDVGSSESAAKLVFAKGSGGAIEIDGDLMVDLEFGGSVRSMVMNGRIGGAKLGDGIADIVVHGRLGSMTTAEVFQREGANGGAFQIDLALPKTGTLVADGGAPIVRA